MTNSPTMTLTHSSSPHTPCQGHCHLDNLYRKGSQSSSPHSPGQGHCHLDNLYRKGSQSSSTVFSFTNTAALCGDLQKLLNTPEICDVKFLVGKSRTPVYGVKAILATRNRTFFDMILAKQRCDVHNNQRGIKQKKSLLSKIKQRLIGKSPSRHLVLEVPDLDAVSFQKVVVYLQTGDISVEVNNVLGVLAAADRYGLDDLRQACHRFALKSLTVNTAFVLIKTAELYPECKWTKLILTDVLAFIGLNAEEFLQRKDFTSISLQSAVVVMSYPGLRATDEQKWDAVYRWLTKQSGDKDVKVMAEVIPSLVVNIEVKNIPIKKLLREVKPLGIVSSDVIKELIAHWSFSTITLLHETKRSSNGKQPSVCSGTECVVDQYAPMNDDFTNECEYEAIDYSTINSPSRPLSAESGFILNADSSMLI